MDSSKTENAENGVHLTRMSLLKGGKDHPPNDVTADHRDSKSTIASGIDMDESGEEIDNTLWGRVKRLFRKIYKVTSSLVGLIVILIAYSFLGAWIFMMIESRHEETFKQNISLARNTIVNELLTTSLTFVDRVTAEEQLKEMLVNYEAEIMESYQAGVTSSSTEEVWTFWTSLFFCGTVYSTIGYGNIAPVTDFGRGVCMLYAALGIPLALLVLAEVGKRFTVVVKFLWAFVRRYYYTGNWRKIRQPFKKTYTIDAPQERAKQIKHETEDSVKTDDSKSEDGSKGSGRLVFGYEVDENFNLPITVAVVILIIYILLGAFMYTWWEDWNYMESFYFVFVSISTIGFGDVLPAHPKYFILSSVYIFIGLSLVSMCINVAIEFFSATADMAKEKMGQATKKIGAKVTEAKDKVQQVGQDIKTDLKDQTDKIKDKVQQVGQDIRTNIIDETDKIKQYKDEKIKKWAKSRSRSNTPVPDDSGSMGDRKQSLGSIGNRKYSAVSGDFKGSKSSLDNK